VKWKKCEKLLKKVVKVFGTGILEVGLRPKKRSPNILAAPPPFQISKYATGPNGLTMASDAPKLHAY
jgi:hypothetical protein